MEAYPLAPVRAGVVSLTPAAPGHFWLTLEAPPVARGAGPGQFVHVRVSSGLDPLLRRPLSIAQSDPASGRLRLLVRVAGEGTARLAALRSGDRVDLVGPLGNGFPAPVLGPVLLAAGGVGVAPVLAAAAAVPATTVCVGARTASLLMALEELGAHGHRVLVATDDGSRGVRGPVTTVVERELDARPYSQLWACGPVPMLRAVQRLAGGRGLPAFISLEQYLACGFGACLGCAVEATRGGYLKVCHDGPVLAAGDVVLRGLAGEGVGRG